VVVDIPATPVTPRGPVTPARAATEPDEETCFKDPPSDFKVTALEPVPKVTAAAVRDA
jgi:hypothetical protein